MDLKGLRAPIHLIVQGTCFTYLILTILSIVPEDMMVLLISPLAFLTIEIVTGNLRASHWMRPAVNLAALLTFLSLPSALIYLPSEQWAGYIPFLAFLAVMMAVVMLVIRFEVAGVSSRDVALIGIFGAIVAVSRIPFAAVPSVQPCTFLVLCIGLVFGARTGMMTGMMTAGVSNMFLGQGPWTPWQMLAWGMVGLIAGLVGKLRSEHGIPSVVILGIFVSLMYDLLMNLSSWILFYGLDPNKFLATYVAGVPFTIAHVAGTVLFILVLGPSVLFNLRRFKDRFSVEFLDLEPMEDRTDGTLATKGQW